MTQMPTRAWQRLLPVTLTALMTLGGGSVSAQTVSPGVSPSASPAGSPAPGASTLEEELEAAKAQVAALTAERDRFEDLLETFDELYDPMEADRQLLVELRKPLPEERTTAEAYLARIQELAILSDPARLGQPASRVLETAPVFLDWRHREFATPAEREAAFLTSGAAGFNEDFQELERAILLTVANRLDALLTLRDRIR